MSMKEFAAAVERLVAAEARRVLNYDDEAIGEAAESLSALVALHQKALERVAELDEENRRLRGLMVEQKERETGMLYICRVCTARRWDTEGHNIDCEYAALKEPKP